MHPIYWLTEIQDPQRSSVGDRAWDLSQLLQQGYPILPGLVIPNEIRQHCLQSLQWSDSLLAQQVGLSLSETSNPTLTDLANEERDMQLRQMTQSIRAQILHSTLKGSWYSRVLEAIADWQEDFVLCRPSLSLPKHLTPHSHSTLSRLWRAWGTAKTPEPLAQTIKQIWAETFRNKYLLYWQYQGIPLNQIRMGILIQPLQNEVISGAIETQGDKIRIESTWGLGYLFSEPQVTSDSYQIHLHPYQLKEQHLGNKRLAYQLSGEPSHLPLETSLFNNRDSLLCAYTVESSWVDRPCLEEAQIQCLGDRTLSLKNQWYDEFRLEWMGYPDLNWWITDIVPLNENHPTALLHQGTGAAPGVAVAPVLVLTDPLESMTVTPGKIIVKQAIAPQETWVLNGAAGLITEVGGISSHGAIVARELGIPALVGVSQATHYLFTGDLIQINGETGEISAGVHHCSSPEPIEVNPEMGRVSVEKPENPVSPPPAPLHATQLWINLSQPYSPMNPSDLDVDGVGLLRSELWAASLFPGIQWWRDVDRFVSEWYKHLAKLAQAFYPRPIYYRSFDSFYPCSLRGTLACELNDQRSTLFDWELTVLEKVHRQGYQNLHLMLPFVRTVEEVVAIRKRVDRRQLSQMELWIMVEVPGVLWQISDYVQVGIDGLSLGTNDLIPLLFGLDRQQWEENQGGLNAVHPLVLRVLEQCITQARAGGIQCSVCGQAVVNYPQLINDLVRWGIASVSVEMPAVDRVRWAIARAEQQLILEAARSQLKIKN